jgi:hypothetical protein
MQRPKSVFSDNSAANHNREQATKRVERCYEDYWQRRRPAVQKGPESSHGLDATDQACRDGSQHSLLLHAKAIIQPMTIDTVRRQRYIPPFIKNRSKWERRWTW